MKFPRRRQNGLALLEIILSLAVAALLVVILVPGWQRARMKDKAEKIKSDLAAIDKAVAEYVSQETFDKTQPIPFDRLKKYLRRGSQLEKSGTDPYGNPYGPQQPDGHPAVPKASAGKLKEVADDKFWLPFEISQN